jgi:predicted transcriptional regulator
LGSEIVVKALTNYAAAERAKRSRARLTIELGPIMREWARFRAAAWRVDRRWTTNTLVARTSALLAGARLDRLTEAPTKIRVLDEQIFGWLAYRNPIRNLEDERSATEIHSVDFLWTQLKKEIPDLSRQRVRNMVARLARKGHIQRVARGRYERNPTWWEYRRQGDAYSDESEERWMARLAKAEHDRLNVVLAHYLLPHLPVHRKALRLEISERTYYDRLATALAYLREVHRPPRNVQ